MVMKLFEIRDAATFISAMAIKLGSYREEERFLLARAGYYNHDSAAGPYVILMRLTDCEAQYDPHSWAGGARTMMNAHKHILEHFDELASGDVIDVEFILGEKPTKKVSERVS